MTIKTRTIETSHGRIALSETSGKGHPVLLIHGNSSCRDVFRHQMASELGLKYRMIAMDLPGHGESDNAADPHSTYIQPAYAAAAAEVLKACDAEDAIVMGWSLGGHIAIEMIPRLPHLRAITITGTPPAGPGAAEVNAAFTPLPHMSFTSKEVFTQEDADAYARYTCGVNLPPDPVLSAAVKRTDGRARQIMWTSWTEQSLGCPQRHMVATWDRPIAVVQGSDEAFFDNAYLCEINWGNLWERRIHVIEGGGHAPFWAKPEQYNEVFGRFLADIT